MTEQEIAAKEKQTVQGQEKTRAGRFFLPEVDIQELSDSLKLFADMPGVKQSDVEVTLNNGILTIVGTVSTDAYQKLSPLYTEYNVGNYFRQFELNEDIDAQRINASMKDGVLELTLPKSERARPRRIEAESDLGDNGKRRCRGRAHHAGAPGCSARERRRTRAGNDRSW